MNVEPLLKVPSG